MLPYNSVKNYYLSYFINTGYKYPLIRIDL